MTANYMETRRVIASWTDTRIGNERKHLMAKSKVRALTFDEGVLLECIDTERKKRRTKGSK
jgi:hypothetical protein